jgi:hypothetical protein
MKLTLEVTRILPRCAPRRSRPASARSRRGCTRPASARGRLAPAEHRCRARPAAREDDPRRDLPKQATSLGAAALVW